MVREKGDIKRNRHFVKEEKLKVVFIFLWGQVICLSYLSFYKLKAMAKVYFIKTKVSDINSWIKITKV